MNEYDGANGGGGGVMLVVVVVVVVIVVVMMVMTMMIINWDVCTEFCCKNQFRNGHLELSEYGVSVLNHLASAC